MGTRKTQMTPAVPTSSGKKQKKQSKKVVTLTKAEFIALAVGTGNYNKPQAKRLWDATVEYVKLQQQLATAEKRLASLSGSLKETFQVPGLRVTYNKPKESYDYVALCNRLGIDFKRWEYVKNLGPVAKAAFDAESELSASKSVRPNEMKVAESTKPTFKLMTETRTL